MAGAPSSRCLQPWRCLEGIVGAALARAKSAPDPHRRAGGLWHGHGDGPPARDRLRLHLLPRLPRRYRRTAHRHRGGGLDLHRLVGRLLGHGRVHAHDERRSRCDRDLRVRQDLDGHEERNGLRHRQFEPRRNHLRLDLLACLRARHDGFAYRCRLVTLAVRRLVRGLLGQGRVQPGDERRSRGFRPFPGEMHRPEGGDSFAPGFGFCETTRPFFTLAEKAFFTFPTEQCAQREGGPRRQQGEEEKVSYALEPSPTATPAITTPASVT